MSIVITPFFFTDYIIDFIMYQIISNIPEQEIILVLSVRVRSEFNYPLSYYQIPVQNYSSVCATI